jgi:hypothetical protein
VTVAQLDDTVHRLIGPYEGNTPVIPSLCVPASAISDGAAGVAHGPTGVTQLPACSPPCPPRRACLPLLP